MNGQSSKNSMESIIIKKISIEEMEQLQQIGRLTFSQTFAATNSEENMNQYLEESFSAEKLTKELNDPCSEFYFALAGNDVIGYLKINFGNSQTEIQDSNSLEIERIYVVNDFHGKKVGQDLYEKAVSIAIDRKATYIWLGVWENNKRALNFYQKNGFVEFDKHVFVLGDDAQTDIMMKKALR